MPTIGILYGVGLLVPPTVESASGTYPAFYSAVLSEVNPYSALITEVSPGTVNLAPLTFASAVISELTPGTISLNELTIYHVHFGGTST